LEVSEARFENPSAYPFLRYPPFHQVQSVLRVRLAATAAALHEVDEIKNLRFFLDGEPEVAGALYELLMSELLFAISIPEGQLPSPREKQQLCQVKPVGFLEGEEVLPSAPHALRSYALLQEYFSFPQKFLFFDVEGLSSRGSSKHFDLYFLFKRAPRRLAVGPENLLLGCTPVINLFPKVSEPIHIDGKSQEYLLRPDARWESTTEIHSIQSLSESLTDGEAGRIEPLYGLLHSAHNTLYWYAERRSSRLLEMSGTDLWLSFVDARLQPKLPHARSLRAHTLCTNRDLATHLDRGDRLFIEEGPHALVHLKTRPSESLIPPLLGEAAWRLISHLSLSHTGLPEGERAVEALREQLRVYAFSSSESLEPQLQAIEELRRETVALRADDRQWRGFCRVQRFNIKIDESRFSGWTPILLGQVLHAYFGSYASVNVFTQLAMESRQREGVWKLWPPVIPPMKI